MPKLPFFLLFIYSGMRIISLPFPCLPLPSAVLFEQTIQLPLTDIRTWCLQALIRVSGQNWRSPLCCCAVAEKRWAAALCSRCTGTNCNRFTAALCSRCTGTNCSRFTAAVCSPCTETNCSRFTAALCSRCTSTLIIRCNAALSSRWTAALGRRCKSNEVLRSHKQYSTLMSKTGFIS
jgi:hypothetical protein